MNVGLIGGEDVSCQWWECWAAEGLSIWEVWSEGEVMAMRAECDSSPAWDASMQQQARLADAVRGSVFLWVPRLERYQVSSLTCAPPSGVRHPSTDIQLQWAFRELLRQICSTNIWFGPVSVFALVFEKKKKKSLNNWQQDWTQTKTKKHAGKRRGMWSVNG